MTSQTVTTDSPALSKTHWLVWVLFSSILFIYLFYLDEGYYSFKWMRESSAWLAFGFYAGLTVGSQWVVWRLAFRKHGSVGIGLSTLLGPIAWWGLFFGAIYVAVRIVRLVS